MILAICSLVTVEKVERVGGGISGDVFQSEGCRES